MQDSLASGEQQTQFIDCKVKHDTRSMPVTAAWLTNVPTARQEKPPFFRRKPDPSRMQSQARNNNLEGERSSKLHEHDTRMKKYTSE